MSIEYDPTILVAVDFDGTLTINEDLYLTGISIVDENAIKWCKKIKELPVKLILYTCRRNESLQQAVEFCKSYGLTFDYVNEGNGKRGESRKVNFDFCIDDKCTIGEIDWKRWYNHIKERCENNVPSKEAN